MTLTVRNLHIEYPGHLVFDDLSFRVADHELVAIETHVLDGGTSLLKGLAGLLRGVTGEVLLDDFDLLNCKPAERAVRVGYVHEDEGLISLLSVLENILLPVEFHGSLSSQEASVRLTTLCEEFGLEDSIFGGKPYELNDVQIRMVNLVRALLPRPRLLLIDEIEGGMSDRYIRDSIATLRRKQEETPMAILITTSDDEVMNNADAVYRIVNKGLVRQ